MQNEDPVLRIKSYAKTPDIHAKFWPCTKNQKLCKKHQKFTQNVGPVLRIKSYAKNTRFSRKLKQSTNGCSHDLLL